MTSDVHTTGSKGVYTKGKKRDLTVFADEDAAEDLQYLGFATMVTTGNHLYVDREWLQEQFDKYGLNEHLLPRKVRPWMAYRRMKNELVDPSNEESSVYVEALDKRLDIQFEIESGEGRYYHLYVKTFYPEDETGEEGGSHSTNKLMTLNYLPEHERMATRPHVEEDSPLWGYFKDFSARANKLFNRHQECHDGNDMRKVIDSFLVDHANTVRFRNGAYFVTAHHEEEIKGLASIWDELGMFKERGQEPVIYDFPVVDNERYRNQIQRLAENKIESMVDNAIEEAFERLGDESSTDALADTIIDDLSEAETFAGEYNALLEARLSVKRALKDRYEEFEEDKEEIVGKVLDSMEE